jgi:TonB-linked SusC/RagA family outer membrane protein
MKITLLGCKLLTTLVLVGSLASQGFPQNRQALFASKAGVKAQQANRYSLLDLLKELEQKYNVVFDYNQKDLRGKTVQITAEQEKLSLQELLQQVLPSFQLEFKKYNDRSYLIYAPKKSDRAPEPESRESSVVPEASAEGPSPATATTQRAAETMPAALLVTGTVQDKDGGALPGVNIIIKGSSGGTTTDADGKFSLNAGESDVLVFSFIGYVSQEVTVNNQSVIDVVMEPDIRTLQEVVVTGYTQQSKRDVTGAVSTVSAETIAQQPVADVASILQGRVAGVTVDGQGGPGATQVVRVRGIGTLGGNDPLYVIDGVQTTGGLNLVNQNDIESITVLKDAASCALYGARGGNGVIVITTKRGKLGTPKVEYNGYVGAEVPRKTPDIMSPQQYADAYWGYLQNSGLAQSSPLYGNGATPVLPDYIVANTTATPFFGGVAAGDPRADPSLYNFNNYRIMAANKNGTNWFKEVLKPAFLQSHQMAISGATDKSNYAVTFNYLDQNGVLTNSYFKRYSLRVNTKFDVNRWLRVGENMQFSYGQQNTVSDHTDQNTIAGLFNTSPLMPVYDIAGNYTGTKGTQELNGDNAVMSRANSKNYTGYNARMLGSAFVEVEPVDGLTFNSRIAIDFMPYQNQYFKDIYPQQQFDNLRTSFSETAGNSLEWRSTNRISYSKTINDLQVDAFVGYEASEYKSRYMTGANDSLFSLSPGFLTLGTGRASTARVGGGQDKVTYASFFGNVNLSFKDRYLFGFTLRRDGSSKFGALNRYGVFPSFSAGWRIKSEAFMDNVTWLDDLKIRASYGTSGNDQSATQGGTINQYQNAATYHFYDLSGKGNSSMEGFALSQIGNPFLQWEVNKTVNIGADVTFLRNFTASFNWFRRLTDKLIYQPPVTSLQGDALRPYQNVMNFVNKGIELELGYASNQNHDFHYNANFNISTYRNEVTYINGGKNDFIPGDAYARQTILSRSEVGQPVSSLYGYIWEGTFQTTDEVTAHATQNGINKAVPESGLGHFKFKDISGPDGKPDGVINDFDRTFIGNPHPRFTYGFSVNLYYKRFDLGIFLQGVSGNDVMNYWRTSYAWPGKYGIGSLDTWSESNRGAKLPVNSNNFSTDDAKSSTFFVEKGSYMRVKNVQLGYTFPAIAGLSKLRVYGQAYNLLTFTNYSGMDPEVNTGAPGAIGIDFGGNYPIAQKYLFGVNLTF